MRASPRDLVPTKRRCRQRPKNSSRQVQPGVGGSGSSIRLRVFIVVTVVSVKFVSSIVVVEVTTLYFFALHSLTSPVD